MTALLITLAVVAAITVAAAFVLVIYGWSDRSTVYEERPRSTDCLMCELAAQRAREVGQ